MLRAQSVFAAIAAALLFITPVAAAGSTTHVRLVDRAAFACASTYPEDGNVVAGTVYRDTCIQVDDRLVREGSSTETETRLSLEEWAFTFDRRGELVLRSVTNLDTSGPAVEFSMDRQFTTATLTATASGVRTTFARTGTATEEPVTMRVSGSWTGTGDVWRGYSFTHASGGATVINLHYRGTGRDDVVFAGDVDGIDVGRTYSGMLSSQLNADLYITEGRAIAGESTRVTTGPAALAGTRLVGGNLMAYWTTYPFDGTPVPDVEYVDTQVYVSGGDENADGLAPFVVVYQDRYTVDADGGWHGVSSSTGMGGGADVILTLDRALTSASVTGTIDSSTCTADGCSGAVPVTIDASWLGQGTLTRLLANERLVAGDVMVHRHARETSREATANMTLAGVPVGISTMALMSSNAEWSFAQSR